MELSCLSVPPWGDRGGSRSFLLLFSLLTWYSYLVLSVVVRILLFLIAVSLDFFKWFNEPSFYMICLLLLPYSDVGSMVLVLLVHVGFRVSLSYDIEVYILCKKGAIDI